MAGLEVGQAAMRLGLILPALAYPALKLFLWEFFCPDSGLLGVGCALFSPLGGLATWAVYSGHLRATGGQALLAMGFGMHVPQPFCSLLSAATVWELAPDHWSTLQLAGAMTWACLMEPTFPAMEEENGMDNQREPASQPPRRSLPDPPHPSDNIFTRFPNMYSRSLATPPRRRPSSVRRTEAGVRLEGFLW